MVVRAVFPRGELMNERGDVFLEEGTLRSCCKYCTLCVCVYVCVCVCA